MVDTVEYYGDTLAMPVYLVSYEIVAPFHGRRQWVRPEFARNYQLYATRYQTITEAERAAEALHATQPDRVIRVTFHSVAR